MLFDSSAQPDNTDKHVNTSPCLVVLRDKFSQNIRRNIKGIHEITINEFKLRVGENIEL